MIKDIEDSLSDLKDHEIKELTISVYHNLSGYVTPEVRKELENKNKIKINFEFNWNDPNSYNIRFKK
jgi:ribonuclease G